MRVKDLHNPIRADLGAVSGLMSWVLCDWDEEASAQAASRTSGRWGAVIGNLLRPDMELFIPIRLAGAKAIKIFFPFPWTK